MIANGGVSMRMVSSRLGAFSLSTRFAAQPEPTRSRAESAALCACLVRATGDREMSVLTQLRIPALYMRGGTSKGVFFHLPDLPPDCQQPGAARDALLLRVLGSPDPYEKQIDGLGNGSSSTSKAVILSRSARADHDVDYLFGQVCIDRPLVDWSGNCGNLSAAVGPCAIHLGLVDARRLAGQTGITVRIWQANTGKTILAHVPLADGKVVELGGFELDGVAFPAAEVALEFLDPADAEGAEGEEGSDAATALFPTGHVVDEL